jgi:hypothetical protein
MIVKACRMRFPGSAGVREDEVGERRERAGYLMNWPGARIDVGIFFLGCPVLQSLTNDGG